MKPKLKHGVARAKVSQPPPDGLVGYHWPPFRGWWEHQEHGAAALGGRRWLQAAERRVDQKVRPEDEPDADPPREKRTKVNGGSNTSARPGSGPPAHICRSYVAVCPADETVKRVSPALPTGTVARLRRLSAPDRKQVKWKLTSRTSRHIP